MNRKLTKKQIESYKKMVKVAVIEDIKRGYSIKFYMDQSIKKEIGSGRFYSILDEVRKDRFLYGSNGFSVDGIIIYYSSPSCPKWAKDISSVSFEMSEKKQAWIAELSGMLDYQVVSVFNLATMQTVMLSDESKFFNDLRLDLAMAELKKRNIPFEQGKQIKQVSNKPLYMWKGQ